MVTKSKRTTTSPMQLLQLPQDWHPEPYQLAAAKFLLENPEGALFLDPGLRKTSITLAAFKILLREKLAKRMLIVAPPRVCRSVWPREVAKWKDFSHLRIEILHGPRKQQALERDADIYCVSYEGLEWLLGVTKVVEVQIGRAWLTYNPAIAAPASGKPWRAVLPGGKQMALRSPQDVLEAAKAAGLASRGRKAADASEQALQDILAAAALHLKMGSVRKVFRHDLTNFRKLNADILLMDEISKLKHTDTSRFEMLKPVLHLFDRRWGLTGSPTANGLMNIFGIMLAIDLGKSLGRYISHFRRQFFFPTGYGGYTWITQPDAEQRIYARIAPYIFRLAGKDYLKLPTLVQNIVRVDLPDDARKVYDEMEDDFITELMGGAAIITAVNSGAAGIKCRQIANGGIYLEQKVDAQGRKDGQRKWLDLHTAKIEATRDIVDELNGAPVLITYDFEHDLARLRKEFGKDTPHIGGGVAPRKSDAILADWNAGKIPILLVHYQSMAHGLNAQEGNAHHVIAHSLTFDFELDDQLIRRLLRSGNKSSKVFIHRIIARDTVDEVLIRALAKKRGVQESLHEAMREYTLARYGKDLRAASRSIAKRLKKP